MNFNLNFLKLKTDPAAKSIYKDWESVAITKTSLIINKAVLAVSLFLIPLDLLIFGNSSYLFTILHTWMVPICLYIILRHSKVPKTNLWWHKTVALLPNALFNVWYILVLYAAPKNMETLVLISTLLVIFFSTFTLYKHPNIQYTNHAIGILALFTILFVRPELFVFLMFLFVCHFCSFVFTYSIQKSWRDSLHERFQSLKRLIPSQVAHHVVTSEASLDSSDFKPEERFVVVLSADWRGYQNITEKLSPNQVAKLFEIYYGQVFDKLETVVPSGTYFSDWVADELTVIFYCAPEEEMQLMSQALTFASIMQDEIYKSVNNELQENGFDIKLRYDIGMAAGFGLLGLQGPKKRQKATLTAEIAGVAKRLEQEAKRIRSVSNASIPPILIVNDILHDYKCMKKVIDGDFTPIVAESKDIVGKTFYMKRHIAAASVAGSTNTPPPPALPATKSSNTKDEDTRFEKESELVS